MNSVNSRIVKNCIKAIALVLLISAPASAWELDLSHRQVDFNRVQNQDRMPASTSETETAGLFERALETVEPAQDIVILNTEKGFVPESVFMRKGGNYRIHVVNVNEKEKNVSFVLDAFSEHHNTMYGKVKTFNVMPKTDGIFTYQCPETNLAGRMVIADPQRQPASVH